MNGNYIVYCHTNKINGKKYIGITQQKPELRWKNGLGYPKNEHFTSAIQKYGWHNFRHEILYTGLSKAEAELLEIKLIAEYKTTNRLYGYNKSNGGNCIGTVSEETKKKISKARKGRKLTPEQNEKNRISHYGQTPWNKGIPWSDEMRVKCGGKSVLCVETGKVYITANEAARALGLDFSSICRCCRRRVKRCGGFHWKYVEVQT